MRVEGSKYNPQISKKQRDTLGKIFMSFKKLKNNHSVVIATVVLLFTITGCSSFEGNANKQSKDEWISLFNGKNLDGWEGDPGIWRVEDGYIYGSGKTSYKSYLINRTHILKDFILEVKFMPVKGNSGVNYRSHDYDADPKQPYEVSGYQCDIGPMGDLYDIYTTSDKKRYATVKGTKGQGCKCAGLVSRTEWNTFRIVANGRNLSHEINGTPCIEFTDDDELGFREKGFIALEFHDRKVKIKFKDIRVKILNQ
ncbi:MAG: DUF1080 domain-containing protein [Planctomycetes bacterium]|nr:DUF1080 domain-containing protein [Planctomycetota bacterium]